MTPSPREEGIIAGLCLLMLFCGIMAIVRALAG